MLFDRPALIHLLSFICSWDKGRRLQLSSRRVWHSSGTCVWSLFFATLLPACILGFCPTGHLPVSWMHCGLFSHKAFTYAVFMVFNILSFTASPVHYHCPSKRGSDRQMPSGPCTVPFHRTLSCVVFILIKLASWYDLWRQGQSARFYLGKF